jgi:hypothetical protein
VISTSKTQNRVPPCVPPNFEGVRTRVRIANPLENKRGPAYPHSVPEVQGVRGVPPLKGDPIPRTPLGSRVENRSFSTSVLALGGEASSRRPRSQNVLTSALLHSTPDSSPIVVVPAEQPRPRPRSTPSSFSYAMVVGEFREAQRKGSKR